jgi:CBS domain-containing protein
MRVSDILRHKGTGVITVDPSTTVESLVALLASERIGAVVVSADGSRVEGIVSERDVVRAVAEHGAAYASLEVGAICTRDVRVAAPEDQVDALMVVMTENRIRHLPVVVDEQLAGLVSIGDVVKWRVSQLEGERQALEDYVRGV